MQVLNQWTCLETFWIISLKKWQTLHNTCPMNCVCSFWVATPFSKPRKKILLLSFENPTTPCTKQDHNQYYGPFSNTRWEYFRDFFSKKEFFKMIWDFLETDNKKSNSLITLGQKMNLLLIIAIKLQFFEGSENYLKIAKFTSTYMMISHL